MARLAFLSRTSPSRRGLLAGGLASGFMLAFHVPVAQALPANVAEGAPAAPPPFAPNAFLRIDKAGKVTLIIPQVEMGQGVFTSLAMMIAEELDADWNNVHVEAAPANEKLYANPMLGVQATGNSNSIRAFWLPMRKAAAGARALLIQAAAKQWGVDAASCTAENSQVIHAASGRKLAYGVLADNANGAAPAEPPLKAAKDFKLIGKPMKRLDTPTKVDGKEVYGIDVMLPGLKFATIAASPAFGGKVRHVDDSAAKTVPGVRQVIVLDDMVAVVGDHFWAAKKGLDSCKIDWDAGPNGHVDSDLIWQKIRAASDGDALVAKAAGNADKSLGEGERIEARFELPFLAHATMEPMNCTVHLTPGACELWLGTQIMARVQTTAAATANVPLEKVIVHNQIIGGGFGRRLEPDMVIKAIRVAQHVDGPLKVVWTREEDIQHDLYRPVYYDRLTATLKDGKIDGWQHRITGSSVVARWLPAAFKGNHNIDFDTVDSAIDIPYAIPNLKVEVVRHEPPAVPTGFWRGVGPNNNVFAIESFMDELANKAGVDPVEFRRAHLAKTPRLLAALNLAAEKADWGKRLPPRHGRGVSAQVSFASFIVTIAQVEVSEDGNVRLHRLTTAVDTGTVVNPDTVVAQLQGGMIFGSTAALFGEITLAKGRVRQSNFHDYRMLRINETPEIDVHLIPSSEPPGGIGETGVTTAPAAIRNAIYAATGVPLRRLPIDRALLTGKRQA
ncbi:MAG TPA: molybdopterin cofactor-binding domain-containing protein [Rhizomicrobium sp.]|nr:molybdopterin cofactor-binding domain-containing protein [Rhizomicrobium sp.]